MIIRTNSIAITIILWNNYSLLMKLVITVPILLINLLFFLKIKKFVFYFHVFRYLMEEVMPFFFSSFLVEIFVSNTK